MPFHHTQLLTFNIADLASIAYKHYKSRFSTYSLSQIRPSSLNCNSIFLVI